MTYLSRTHAQFAGLLIRKPEASRVDTWGNERQRTGGGNGNA